MKWLLAVALLAACDRHEPLSDCGGDLRGVWTAPGGKQFQLIAGPSLWELYPMFDDGVIDTPLEEGIVPAPSAIDIVRIFDRAPVLFGVWHRRYERRNRRCLEHGWVILSQCKGSSMTLSGLTPPPPSKLEGCAPGVPEVFEWRLERD